MSVPILRDVSHRVDEWPFPQNALVRLWIDDAREWMVQVFEETSTDGTPWEGTLRVGINHGCQVTRSFREIVVSWSTIQAIKDQLYPGRIAIEVFPPQDQIVNVAPMRWLWVLPRRAYLPFNLSGSLARLDAQEVKR